MTEAARHRCVSVSANIWTVGATPAQRVMLDLRRRTGLSQAELGRRAGVPRSIINAYEHGRREPGADSLSRIAASVGLELGVAPPARDIDLEKAGRILGQVLDLAESLPARKRGGLRYPVLNAPPK